MKLQRAIVLGKGKWGKIFISRLKNKVKIVKILRSRDNYKIIDYKKIDWIFVLTNTKKHYEICDYYISRCSNIFCEKPLTTDLYKCEKLIKKAKENNCNLYISDIENYKLKKLKLRLNNIIIRKKFSFDKTDLLFRYAYHDLYVLSNKINLRDMSDLKIVNNKLGELNYTFKIKKKKFEFIYSFNSTNKVHKINNIDFLLFNGNPLDKMIKNVLLNKINTNINHRNALDAVYILNKIKKKLFKNYD